MRCRRFLRARKFDVPAAVQQFETTEQWRKKEDIDALYDNFPVDEFIESQSPSSSVAFSFKC